MRTAVLHRDIRPTNIIVSDESPLSAAVLTNFSLGCDAGAGPTTSEDSLDTALYRSPEHAGSMDYDVGATSDLYSAGIVLFECLAGHPPFGGDTVGAVLLTHMTSHVPELRAAGLNVPRPLDELIQRLLRKDPRDRYQTAEAVLLDLEGIAASLDGGTGESAVRRRIARSPLHAHRAGVRRPSKRLGASGRADSARLPPGMQALSSWRPNRAAARRGSWRKSPCAASKRECGSCTAADWKWWDSGRFRCCTASSKT